MKYFSLSSSQKSNRFFLIIQFFAIHFSVNAAGLSSTNYSGDSSSTHSQVERVEPPFWWAGMQNKTLQLMLYGKNIASSEVSSVNSGWKITSIERSDNPNYLFVNLLISADAKAGNYQLQLNKKDGLFKILNYQLKSRKKDSSLRQGFSSADVIYLITPDRFSNGDTTNDSVANLKEGVNRANPDGRHGGDIQGVIDHLDYIADMGFTQIWLNPVLQNDQQGVSYHGYSTTDYYQVDGRYGDNSLYRSLSRKARERGVGLLKDIILNHIGSEHWWMKDLPAKDWINNNAQFTPTNHRREALYDPHAVKQAAEKFTDGWFVESMPDLNQKNEKLANYLIQNTIWWIEYADLSGIRLDTYSYSDADFLSRYSLRIMQEYPNFNMVGEEWILNPTMIAYWQKDKINHDGYQSYLPSLMDFPLQDALVNGLLEDETWKDGLLKIYAILANDFVYADADNLVVFADNHDMSRIHSQLNHDIALTKMAMAFFATTRGIPQVFYGTEILMSNPSSTAHGIIRGDFPGGWKNDKTNGFSGKGLNPQQKSMQKFLQNLLNWRKNSTAVQTGKLTHYDPQQGVYVYFRTNNSDKVMVVINKNNQIVKIDPAKYSEMLKSSNKKSAVTAREIISGDSYRLDAPFEVPAKSALILDFNN